MDVYCGHDLGTGGDKAVLVDGQGRVVAEAFEPYPLEHPRPGWAEQDPEDYWRAVAATTRRLLAESGVAPSDVVGVGFAGQMLTQVPVDVDGRPTRRAISWLDARAVEEAASIVRRLGGPRLVRVVAGAVPSAKDVVAKWLWLRRNEPDVWERTAALTDATGYLVARATGVVCADHTAGGGTGMINRGRRTWNPLLLRASGLGGADVQRRLPPLRPCPEVVGGLLPDAAADLGLTPGTPVIAGVGDVPAAQVGSGAVRPGEAHVCLGTSGWLCVTTDRVADLPGTGVFSLPAAAPGLYATVGEMETAGECLDWLGSVLAADGVAAGHAERAAVAQVVAAAAAAPAGCDGLTFAPWLFGERAPVNDPSLRGAFLGLSLNHTRAHLCRSVLEGVAHNLRWLIDAVGAKGLAGGRLRVIGGGVQSDLWMQIVADVTGRVVETVPNPQYAGARGAAMLAMVGVGALGSVLDVADLTSASAVFTPTTDAKVRVDLDRAHVAFRAALPAARGHARALAQFGA